MKKTVRTMIAICLMVATVFGVSVTANAANARPIRDGWYMMVCKNSDDLVLDIAGANKKNNANLIMYKKTNDYNQRFWLEYNGDGFYTIKARHSNRYLHIANEKDKKSNVHQYQGYTHNNAQWALKSDGNGYYYLINRGNGSYLAYSNNKNKNVQTWPTTKKVEKLVKWKLLSTSDGYDQKQSLKNGWYEIQSGNNNKYIWDVDTYEHGTNANGANLQICKKEWIAAKNNQKFYLKWLGNGYYSIQVGQGKNKFLHKENAGRNDNVHQWSSSGALQTQWAIASCGNGYYYVRSKAGNYVDNRNGTVKNRNNVGTCIWNGSAAQRWKFKSA